MRSIRALRDLRRYATQVIVNNQGGQVNVATEGSQQANMQTKTNGGKKPKQPKPAVSPAIRLASGESGSNLAGWHW